MKEENYWSVTTSNMLRTKKKKRKRSIIWFGLGIWESGKMCVQLWCLGIFNRSLYKCHVVLYIFCVFYKQSKSINCLLEVKMNKICLI